MAATILHIEWTLELVETYLKANLQTKLTAIEASKLDKRTPDAPLTKNYSINELDEIPEFPFVQIVPDTTDTEIPGGTWDEDVHNIIIKAHNVTTRGSTYDCAVKSYRYARAISEVILDNRTLGDNVIGFYRTNIDYTPMLTDGNSFKQEIWVFASIKHHGQAS
jgi:hypothetical protein